MSNIYIAGISMTVFGRHLERSLEDLAGEALQGALKDANCQISDIGTAYYAGIDMAVNARSDFNGADADSLREWREGLYETRRNFLGIAARTSQRFDQTFALIQRTQMLEKTLRTQLSPQMSAALRFSRTLGSQVQ